MLCLCAFCQTAHITPITSNNKPSYQSTMPDMSYQNTSSNDSPIGWWGLSYNPVTFYTQNNSEEVNGFTLEDDIFAQISRNFYVGFSPLNAQFIFSNKKQAGIKVLTAMLALKPAVDFAYKCELGNKDIYLLPNAGFDIGVYIIGSEYVHGSKNIKSQDINLFKDLDYNRFIFNWHTGVQLCIRGVFFNIKYEGGIAPLYSNGGQSIRVNQWHFGIGFEV